MHASSALFLLASLVTPSFARSLRRASEPCASISSLSKGGSDSVPAALAYDCLNSVPINVNRATQLVEGLYPYVQWQSTLSYLANPPEGYLEPAIDILGGLDAIGRNVTSNVYKSEYAFQMDLYNLFVGAHDGHFTFVGDAVGSAFSFMRGLEIVSVSSDGQQLPQVYVWDDFANTLLPPKQSYTPSAIKLINGQDPAAYLESLAQSNSFQDPDALYNALFLDLAQLSLGNAGAGAGTFAGGELSPGGFIYPGPETNLTFANGTTKSYLNYASVIGDFSDVRSGDDFYSKFCSGPAAETSYGASSTDAYATPTATSGYYDASDYSWATYPTGYATDSFYGSEPTVTGTADASDYSDLYSYFPTTGFYTGAATSTAAYTLLTSGAAATATPTPALGFPEPEILHTENYIGGYFLNDTAHQDVAVLSVPSFVGEPSVSDLEEFQAVARQFLAAAVKAGKKKLIVDLSSNGGGTVYLAYDLFKQLFPTMEPMGNTRFRAHDSLNVLGQQFSELASNYSFQNPPSIYNETYGEASFEMNVVASPFNYRADETTDDGDFASWADLYGPHKFNGDDFTSLVRYNLSDPLQTYYESGINITGYLGARNQAGAQPFAAEDIVMLYNGYCASTCAIFSEFMKTEGKVHSIAVGGRPQTGPMQGVGGVKGANDYSFALIWEYIATALSTATSTQLATWNKGEIGNFTTHTDYAMNRSYDYSAPGVNVRDNIRVNDSAQTPLQFVYEAADCRLFYTPAMTVDVTALWRAAADAMWNAGQGCVNGSTGSNSSLSGNAALNGTSASSKSGSKGSGGKHKSAAAVAVEAKSGLGASFVAVVFAVAFACWL
ncbi:MAG: hypothetical protein M1819_004645 [Sarea resinae]|nr:MAG: hypothetical protein M1819_004645 [Sarea resinae]